jgi:hypothetical protein
MECGLDVCGVLGLTWVLMFFWFSGLYEEGLDESFAFLPCVSFRFKRIPG